MPHIHDLIDLTVAGYVVYNQKVLLVEHKKLHRWLPPGGHVELSQDPEEALFAELAEETGLQRKNLVVIGEKPTIESPGTKFLYPPAFLNIHEISSTHRHIGMIYVLASNTDSVLLAEREHTAIRWFDSSALDDPAYNLMPAISYYARKAIEMVNES